jgi:undecaprenyl-diphosphatase
VIRAIVLGIVQGLTEFLPVSSSGHLVVIPYLLSWEQPPLSFGVAVHFGSLLAVIAYFAGDLWFLATRMFGIGASGPDEVKRARTTVALLVVGTIPAAVIGATLESQFEKTFEDPRFAASFLLVTAGLLWLAETIRRRRISAREGVAVKDLTAAQEMDDPGRHEGTTTFGDAVIIGFAQALAIFPGISRAGATMAAGMLRGLSRQGAARFSFLLSIPIILGATIFEVPEFSASAVAGTAYGGWSLIAGTAAAAVSGFWAIRYLLRLVADNDLLGFARYVAFFGILTWVGYLWIGPPSQI